MTKLSTPDVHVLNFMSLKMASKNFCLPLIHGGAFTRRRPGRPDEISTFIFPRFYPHGPRRERLCNYNKGLQCAAPKREILLSRRSPDDEFFFGDFPAKSPLLSQRELVRARGKIQTQAAGSRSSSRQFFLQTSRRGRRASPRRADCRV